MARERQRSDTNQCEHPNHHHQQRQQPPRPPSPLLLLFPSSDRDRQSHGERKREREENNNKKKTGSFQRTASGKSYQTELEIPPTTSKLWRRWAARLRWLAERLSALQGAERTEQGRQNWSLFFSMIFFFPPSTFLQHPVHRHLSLRYCR